MLIRFEESIKRLENYKGGDEIKDIINGLIDYGFYGIPQEYSNDHNKSIHFLLNNYNILKGIYISTNSKMSRIMDILKGFKQERTGLMKIQIVLMNFGNTDGLISRAGVLKLINEKKEVKIKMSNINIIPKVEKQ